jgi:hypothetical protein
MGMVVRRSTLSRDILLGLDIHKLREVLGYESSVGWSMRWIYGMSTSPEPGWKTSDTAMEHMHHQQREPISKKEKLIKSPTKKMQQN